ncbi:ScbR family autoregulator-binding transcription factor [Rhodococcus sp. DMU1]|uniref:ScbR family autoregulator-binding transcription factor n=1 Tax=Rhodococcus sp. DMU1 TaxID=2722825 RepID=UPI00143E9483|nr:ScbR family autoregulator-binding transcription factor [Rhodococcus sp. DMU1]QIX49348.1 TetR/AcrR family transcriptional regulator [Rhodococcus sp. DMU1]
MAKQVRAAVTRQQIVHAAAAMFDERGFHGASFADILRDTGLSKGAVYFHFASKIDLAGAIVAEQHRRSIALVDAIAGTEASTLEQIVMLCHGIGRQMIEDPVVRAGIRLTLELGSLDKPAGPYLDWITACEAFGRRAVEEGDLDAHLDPSMLAHFVISAFTGVQLLSDVLAGRVDLEERIDQMWTLLLPGIMPTSRHDAIETVRGARWSLPLGGDLLPVSAT